MPTKDPEKLKRQRQRYYNKHKDLVKIRYLKWKKENPDRIKEYRKKHSNSIKSIEYNKKYRKTEKFKNYKNEKRRQNSKDFYKKPHGMYNHMLARIKYNSKYKNRKLLINKDDFINFVLNNESYKRIFKEWKDMNYEYVLTPTVDRINNNGDYSLDNIQILTLLENSSKRDL